MEVLACKMEMDWIDFGLASYLAIHVDQHRLISDRISNRIPDAFLVGEHFPIYTAGRKLSVSTAILPENTVFVERGGDVTYHGPGQLIVYPIRYLPEGQRDLHKVLREMEDWIIALLRCFGIVANRNPGWTGVWVEHPVTGQPLKIASIGLAVKRWVTYHGLALNVCTDMEAFHKIQPCGLLPSVMTNMEMMLQLQGQPLPDHFMEKVKDALYQIIVAGRVS